LYRSGAAGALLLPPTDLVYGRPGKRRSHYLYKCGDPLSKASLRRNDENKKCLVELRMGGGGKGSQSVLPGSVHPSGERYEWDADGEPAVAKCATLVAAVTKIAVGVLLVRHWPASSRHDAALRVGSFLARCKWDADDISNFMVAVQQVAGVDDPTHVEAGRKAAVDGHNYYEKDGKGYGFPAMAEMFGEPTAKQIAKLIEYRESQLPVAAQGLSWREVTEKGRICATLYNARVAVTGLGVECRYDLFHHKIILEYRGTVHEWSGGELDDIALTRMRQFVSEQFDFDPGAIHLLDAIKTIAVEHCFDPVLELLDAAQRDWDKKPRLDNWVVTYLGCEDTKLNRAIGRKTLIAAVHRARDPGCKYDIITVLEGAEGVNKSTAIRVLAGDEILGVSDKEAQEQLDGIWMHESADLAGMTRADVEQVKAFASRQVDRARPAYGRVREDRKRRSIEFGTTNNNKYLMSQTGNRRIWPLEVGQIDIEALRRDRLQLLGEAATYEADGESVLLDQKLWPVALKEQEKRRVTDPWEDILANIPETVPLWKRKDRDDDGNREPDDQLRIIHRDRDEELVASRDLIEHVLKIPPVQQKRSDSMRIADVMRALGWKRNTSSKVSIDGVQVRGYWRKFKM
jgi:predicted P-loop ATPase